MRNVSKCHGNRTNLAGVNTLPLLSTAASNPAGKSQNPGPDQQSLSGSHHQKDGTKPQVFRGGFQLLSCKIGSVANVLYWILINYRATVSITAASISLASGVNGTIERLGASDFRGTLDLGFGQPSAYALTGYQLPHDVNDFSFLCPEAMANLLDTFRLPKDSSQMFSLPITGK